MKKYNYLNTSLKNIKGEQWEDIPGFEFYFKISNYGRLKRLKFEQIRTDGRLIKYPEKIMKLRVNKAFNKFIGDYVCHLSIRISLLKRIYGFSIARTVYNCFVEPFNTKDPSILILPIDGDGLNIKLSNLKMASHIEKVKRVSARNRRLPELNLSEEGEKKRLASLKLLLSRQVSQYTMAGKKIETYSSISIAAEKTGISQTLISRIALHGKGISAGGFLWRYGNGDGIDIEHIYKTMIEGKKKSKEKLSKKITQYTMDGNRVATFSSVREAGRVIGIEYTCIGMAVRGKAGSAGGFYWKEGDGPAFIDLSAHVYGEALRSQKADRPVCQLSKEGEPLQNFKSIMAAARAIGIDYNGIRGVLTGRQKTAGGYKWKYIDK